MITQDKFYGRAMVRSGATLYGQHARLLDISAAVAGTGITLPVRTKLRPGGPYYKLLNTGGSSMPLKNETGATILTMANNTLTTVLLGTSKWKAYGRSINVAKTFGSDTAARTQPVGYVSTASVVTEPTSYDSIACDGGYRRARNCITGAFANVWMLDTDVTPHMVASVAPFKYRGQCFYFKESDRLLTGHGDPTLTASDVAWFNTCELCAASLMCDSSNPAWPASLTVHFQDNSTTSGNNLTGDWDLIFNGGGYDVPAPSALPLNGLGWFMSLQCDSTGWKFRIGFDFTIFPGGAGIDAYSEFQFPTPSVLPSIGNYPFKTGFGDYSSGCGVGGCWATSTVQVLGYGVR